MDVDEIAVVMSRASQLRSRINNCIDKATQRKSSDDDVGGDHPRPLGDASDDEDEADSLSNIRDALESLEDQLGSLQVLQQQQRYEREATLAMIDCSRRILLNKLKEYKGEDLEVIHEATVFAGETVEHDDDLLLPPYPSRLPDSIILDDSYQSHLASARNKSAWIGITGDARHEIMVNKSDKQQIQASGKSSRTTGIKLMLGMAAKTIFTLVSVISVLSLAGFEPKLRKRSTQFKVLDLFQKPVIEEEGGNIQCPPGKVLVIEDGKPRCLVKERVEIPFEPVIASPDISYGFG